MSPSLTLLGAARRGLVASILVLLSGAATAEMIRISGVGASMPLLERLADVYRAQAPDDIVQIVVPPLGTDGALRALAAGKLDLAVAGRPPRADEAVALGRTVGLGRTALGFATRDGVRAPGLSAADVADIYAGRVMRWDDERPIRVILRAERESDTRIVRGISAATDAAMNIAHARKGLVVADNDLDAAHLLETVPGSFGPMSVSLARLRNSPVRFLPLDGVLPSAQAVADGRYPLAKEYFVVEPKAPGKAATRFAVFLKSAQAAAVMAAADVLPAR